ncbi:MAG: SigE family RNA polymerase sigma factor [Catenulispora sp.]|nr:SigE family RNA polymerase sigma factor [Catenulispora sp.]
MGRFGGCHATSLRRWADPKRADTEYPHATWTPSARSDSLVTNAFDEFTEFAQARQGHLRRLAFLLSGDWHDAQDLTQTALLNLCRHWGRARRAESLDGYAHKVLVHAFLNHRKKYRRDAERALDFTRQVEREHGTPAAAPSEQSELRLTLLHALAQLAPRGRAVLVLRFWEDLSVEATAAVLGCSAGNVKSQSSRALARLRAILGDSLLDGFAEPTDGSSGGSGLPGEPDRPDKPMIRPARPAA